MNLTKGAVANIWEGQGPAEAYLQVLAVRKFPTGDRFRLMVSDGVHKSGFAILSSQLCTSGDPQELLWSILHIKRYHSNETGKKKMMIILEMDVVSPGSKHFEQPIGDPQTYDSTQATQASPSPRPAPQANGNRPNGASPMPSQRSSIGQGLASKRAREDVEPPPNMPNVRPISSLTPYQNKWTIRARVSNKGTMRTYSNARGEGKVFSFDVLDESGEIRITCFNAEVDKFLELIEENKVFFISGANIKTANKQWSKVKNDYEMTLNSQSQVVEAPDDGEIPTLQFDFVSLKQLEGAAKHSNFDVIGICQKVSELGSVTKRTTGEEIKKREITLVDSSNASVSVTIWAEKAEKFDGSGFPVIAVKNALSNDFNGVSLTCTASSSMQINPDIKEAHELKGWWESSGSTINDFSQLSSKSSSVAGNTPWKSFEETKQEGLGSKDAFDYYNVKATVVLVRKENLLYTACPTEKCNKKVTDMSNGMYRCEKCNQEYDSFKWRLMGSINLSDFSGDNWVSMFQETGEQILGMSAQEVGSLKEDDSTRFLAVTKEACFKDYNFKLRCKMETYNDESRIKTNIYSVSPIDYVEYNKRLLKEIKEMAA